MKPLLKLKELGQSVWYDNIERGIITSGELGRMIDEYGLSGVTSNPTIFEKAVTGSEEYDADIAGFAAAGLNEEEILTELFTTDVRLAADVFSQVHEQARGRDGFVSIEVRPSLARDTQATVAEALALHKKIGRPNIMIKVPGTAEGLEAVEELVYRGINVNVTLLFSVERYAEVAMAYIRGLERRADEGRPIDKISGVASFFVSRFDTLVERLASNKPGAGDVLGKAAVANARLAFIRYNEVFGHERFARLSSLGAAPQRLLWASTSTKNPLYSDVLYVEELIEEGTVNTMPMETLLAFNDHGSAAPRLSEGIEEARRVIDSLKGLGIDYTAATDELEEEGIEKFAASYDSLAGRVGVKMEEMLEKNRA